MQERKYSKELLKAIKDGEKTIVEDGLDVLIKPIPDDARVGVLDPRFHDSIAPNFSGIKGVIAKKMMGMSAKKKPTVEKSAKDMRNMMNGVKSISIVDSVDVLEKSVQVDGRAIPIRIYNAKQPHKGLRPVFYYIHGGGFVAGGMEVVDEMCKLIVEQSGCVAVQVEYRLAPENPYPAGLNDCYDVLKWVHANAKDFGGDASKICISGDSAGGNLATVCSMKTRDDKTNMVRLQALLYPSVDAANMEKNMELNHSLYVIGDEHKAVINGFLGMMGMLNNTTLGEYLAIEDDSIPYFSPSLGNLVGMPPTIILLGEYDFLRYEDDTFAHKLQAAKVPVKLVRYLGLSHGFADQVGTTPQAEDCLDEIGKFMDSHFA